MASSIVRACLSLAVCGVALACGASHEQYVQMRAADDFECTAKAVNVEEVARSRYHARGCGKEGEYICSATPDGADCSLAPDLDVESPSTLATTGAPAASTAPTAP